MSRVLAYCGFEHAPPLSLPPSGVQAAPVQQTSFGALRLLWSKVEWPFAAEQTQKHAVEFHGVVDHVFKQIAVIPFRLLSVFDDEAAMVSFITENQNQFLQDLDRLKNFVQMEFVVYPAPQHPEPAQMPVQHGNSSGKAYLEQKAGMLRGIHGHVEDVKRALEGVSHQVAVREAKSGHRVFVLVERGREETFREQVKSIAVPEGLSRRVSGPWPAAEFLSEQVKAPQIAPTAGAK